MNEPFATFLQQLRRDLAAELPGRAAQHQMAPLPRPNGAFPYDQPAPDARRGGVLVLFYPYAGRLYLPLILRPTYNGVHSGQVGFPGGGYEPGDDDLVHTALREANEEVGVRGDQVEILGQLSPLYIFASNYLVQPTVGWTPARPAFHTDPYEVERLVETPVSELLDPANVRVEEWELRSRVATVPFFLVQGQRIWGATAMMLAELLAIPALQTFAQRTPV